jgi:hypothetical protein
MKNIHVLPTDKPSRLFLNKVNKKLLLDDILNPNLKKVLPSGSYQHLYITSDEEIKKGDWCYQVELNDCKIDKCYDVTLYHTWTNNGVDKKIKYKKIILTTDQDLIKDGVQAINDEFLEWFVKNPSCEFVEVDKNWNYPLDKSWEYKIIIPKEEPKQETLEDLLNKKANQSNKVDLDAYANGLDDGAKWQAERMYSEEEVIILLQKYRFDLSSGKTPTLGDTTKYWFKQFKKK